MAAGAARPAIPERRLRSRHDCPDPSALPIRASVGRNLWTAPVHNISADGMAIVLDCRVDPGTLVAVELLNRSGNFWHLKLLRVVHATPHPGERWLVGSAFLKQFTEDEFKALLG
jgi:hypothetical protein